MNRQAQARGAAGRSRRPPASAHPSMRARHSGCARRVQAAGSRVRIVQVRARGWGQWGPAVQPGVRPARERRRTGHGQPRTPGGCQFGMHHRRTADPQHLFAGLPSGARITAPAAQSRCVQPEVLCGLDYGRGQFSHLCLTPQPAVLDDRHCQVAVRSSRRWAQCCSPSHDHRGMLMPSGTSSADSW
jgi:hypothetical protein